MRKVRFKGATSLWSILVVASCAITAGSFSNPQDQTRGLRVKRIEESRPPSAAPVDPRQPRTYRSATSTTSSAELRKPASPSEAILGVTVWRLRPSEASDKNGARILEHKAAKNTEWIAERIEAGSPLNEGDRVRISIESPSSGYLYVIDREQHSDGSLGDAYVIFPTDRTRGGNNTVAGGRVIEFPAQDDNPPYFTLTRSSADHVGEMLVVIVSPQPLADVRIGSEPTKIASELVARWEKDWGAKADQFELEGGAGRAYTSEEKAAGADGSRMLRQGDPLPQTVFRLDAKPGSPLLVKIILRIGK
ncbi:MAG TPA: DUF4384 domain-containing protein [Blastocatellia bacterium]|nr:DUF4384 domain-containing protein [Blastocatellia bacterium]